MTVVLGLRSAEAVVLAADSQRSEGGLRDTFPKLFRTSHGLVWGVAGSIPIQQELHPRLESLSLGKWTDTRASIVAEAKAARHAIYGDEEPSHRNTIDGLFGWYSSAEKRSFLLKIPWSSVGEMIPKYTAIGGPQGLARFALSQSEHLGFDSLNVEALEMVAFNAADHVIRASAKGVALPVQIATSTRDGATVLSGTDTRAVEDTVAAFRELQRAFLVRQHDPFPPPDTGVRPT